MSDPFSLPPETVTVGQLYMALQSMNARMAVMASEQTRLRTALEQQERDTTDMLAAWRASGTVLRIIKWTAAVGTGVGATYAFMRGLLQ